MVNFGEFLKTWSLRSNSVTRQVSFKRTKIGGKCQNSKMQMRHFGWFSNTLPNISFRLICLNLGNCSSLIPRWFSLNFFASSGLCSKGFRINKDWVLLRLWFLRVKVDILGSCVMEFETCQLAMEFLLSLSTHWLIHRSKAKVNLHNWSWSHDSSSQYWGPGITSPKIDLKICNFASVAS